MRHYLKIFIIVVLLITVSLPLYAQQNGNNATVIRNYIPPDIYFPPGKIYKLEKLDLNKASLEQLLALPDINEDLALKIMNRRPIKSLQDLTRLPYIKVDRMKIIVQGFAHLVTQPLQETDEELKQ